MSEKKRERETSSGNKMRPKMEFFLTSMVFKFKARIAVFGGLAELLTDGHTDLRTDKNEDEDRLVNEDRQ